MDPQISEKPSSEKPSSEKPSSILHLTLTKSCFDMIANAGKREEYREIKPYWLKRLQGRHFKTVRFRNGYRADSPVMVWELEGIKQGVGRSEWGAPVEPVFILSLGKNLGNS